MTDKVQPLVSIGIPTYNRANTYLTQVLRSATDQTYTNIEIVISDNASTDNTEEVVTGFSDSRIKYYKHPKNIGPNNNFNYCLQQATGDYFLLLHDDDLIDTDFVETCMEAANYQAGFGLILTGSRIIDAEGKIVKVFPNHANGCPPHELFRSWFLDKTALYLCSTLYNTKELKALGGFHSKHNVFQDAIATAHLALKCPRIDIKKIKASFRKHSGELTYANQITSWCEDSLLLLDIICEPSPENDVLRSEGKRFFSGMTYGIASGSQSPLQRLMAYAIVFRTFKYPPPIFYRFFYRNPWYRRLLGSLGLARQDS